MILLALALTLADPARAACDERGLHSVEKGARRSDSEGATAAEALRTACSGHLDPDLAKAMVESAQGLTGKDPATAARLWRLLAEAQKGRLGGLYLVLAAYQHQAAAEPEKGLEAARRALELTSAGSSPDSQPVLVPLRATRRSRIA